MRTNQEWRNKASCWDHPTVPRGAWDFDNTKLRQAALEVCRTCPVRRECYDDAVADYESEGIRGGSLFRIRPLSRIKDNPLYGVPDYQEV